MSLAQILSGYLALNLLVAVGFLSLRLISGKNPARSELQANYRVIALIIGITVFQPFVPRSNVFNPMVRVWSAESFKSFSKGTPPPLQSGYIRVPTLHGAESMSAARISWILLALALGITLIAFFRITKEIAEINQVRRTSFLLRRRGSVRIYLNEKIQVPFSFWLPGRADVVIPSSLVAKPVDFKMAINHELQHHRQRDTVWVYGIWFLKILCGANPFIYLWNRKISELQEFACDETLVDQNKVESKQYARCLVEVAETASRQKFVPECATGLIFLVDRNLLKRRIERMLNSNQMLKKRSVSKVFALSLVGLLMGVAYASNSWVQDRRITQADADKMAEKINLRGQFPIEVNDLVVRQLNRYVGTPEGREFMRASLSRMKNYQPLVENKLSDYGMPIELLAIPVVESGYQNLEESHKNGHGAGLWQFIKSTAKNFGMRVDEQVDERLNTPMETDAAMRYLKSNFLRFKDWRLSVMAYNIGENHLSDAIAKTGSHDAFTIVRAGFENDTDYLARVMAAILILNNPDVVK